MKINISEVCLRPLHATLGVVMIHVSSLDAGWWGMADRAIQFGIAYSCFYFAFRKNKETK